MRAAKTACLSGDYPKGVALLAELFVDTNDLTYLFNQGRCYEQNGKYEEAIIRFREFQLKNTEAGKPLDASTEQHIAKCQALLAQQKPAVESHPPTVAPAAMAPGAQQAAVSPPMEPTRASPGMRLEVAQPAPAPATAGSGLRIAGVTTMAVGVAGIATGVIMNLKANSLASELEASTTSYDRDKASSRSTYEALGWVGYGVGAAGLVGGVILYYVGHVKGQKTSAPSVALLPAFSSGMVGATLKGAL